jgi:hypothetical protein
LAYYSRQQPGSVTAITSQLSDDESKLTIAAVCSSGLAAKNIKQRSSHSNTSGKNKISGCNSKDNPLLAALAKYSSSLCLCHWGFRDKAPNCVSPSSWQRTSCPGDISMPSPPPDSNLPSWTSNWLVLFKWIQFPLFFSTSHLACNTVQALPHWHGGPSHTVLGWMPNGAPFSKAAGSTGHCCRLMFKSPLLVWISFATTASWWTQQPCLLILCPFRS